jgi:endoglucanase
LFGCAKQADPSPSDGGSTSNGGSTGNGGSTSNGGSTGNGGSTSNGGTGGSPTQRAGAPGVWNEGLSMGPNGPIPLVLVDQFGYRVNDPKVALVRDPRTGYDAAVDFTPGRSYALLDAASGVTVREGALEAWNAGREDSSISGDAVWTFDFSDVTTPGRYFVLDLERGVRSPEFVIGDDVYRTVMYHALRTFYYQRAGFEKTAETAGAEWADAASHLEQDTETRDWLDQNNASKLRDLHGGWYDAGDYNKYTTWHARYLITLLRAFTHHPDAFGDDLKIPESGNGAPDLLDEVKFGLDWLVRMQNTDGSVLCIQSLSDGSPPSSATGPSYYGPPTSAATSAAAGAFAYAARVFATRSEAQFTGLAADYLARARAAWEFASQNPSLTYFNNDDAKQPGSKGLGAGQQEVDDAGRRALQVEAAAYLFERTGEAVFRDFFDQNYATTVPSFGLSHWEVERHEAVLDYATLPSATPAVASAIKADFVTKLQASDGLLTRASASLDAYRSAIDVYTWGSSNSKAAAGRLMLMAEDYGLAPETLPAGRSAAANYLHYLHGVNPLGLVYLTNMAAAGAEHSARTLYHSWFSYKSPRWSEVTATTPGPAPGFVVGGPNPMFSVDGCCTDGSQCFGSPDFSFCSTDWTPPLAQPPAKSYRQFNSGWPANSWAVTENSNGYQVQYIRLLAAFTD